MFAFRTEHMFGSIARAGRLQYDIRIAECFRLRLRRLRDKSRSRLRRSVALKTYYFHLQDGTDVLLDPDGRDLPSLEAVAGAALFEARAIISADAKAGRIILNQRIEVEDDQGNVVHSLPFENAIRIDRG